MLFYIFEWISFWINSIYEKAEKMLAKTDDLESEPLNRNKIPPRMYRKRASETMGALYEDVEKFFGDIFACYARVVVRFPLVFVLIPLFVCGLLGLGMINFKREEDVQKLYAPTGSQSLENQRELMNSFPINSSLDFYSHQQIQPGIFGELIVSCREDADNCMGNILLSDIITEIHGLYAYIVNNITIGDLALTYKDLCQTRATNCYVHGATHIGYFINQINSSGCVNMPEISDIYDDDIYPVLSDVVFDANNCLNASAIWLRFYLKNDDAKGIERGLAWEERFIEFLSQYKSNKIHVSYRVSQSLDLELKNEVEEDRGLFYYSIIIMLLYATIIGAGSNWVSNHVTLAYVGVFAALLSIMASCGLLSLCGMPFVSMSGLMPFLILSIGADDMFHLMTEWRQTCIRETIEERLEFTMRNAAVSVTIASMVDIFAFCIGATCPFVSVKNFCALSGVAIFFCYFNQMTLFTGYLVLNAKRIQTNRHCVTCLPVDSLNDMIEGGQPTSCVILCSGHPPKKSGDEGGICRPFSKVFYRIYPKILLNRVSKFIVIIGFLVYICMSVFGVTFIHKGFSFNRLVSEKSHLAEFLSDKWGFYPGDGLTLILAATSAEQYHKPSTYENFISTIREAQSLSDYIRNDTAICWYTNFHNFLEDQLDKSVASEIEFIEILRNEFLPENPIFVNDIAFNERFSKIIASRCYLFSTALYKDVMEMDLLVASRTINDNEIRNFTLFSHEFIFFEHYLSIVKDVILVVGVTMIGLLFVALVFIPHPIAITCVTITMLSVTVGMIACMSLLDLHLSAVTIIQIVLGVAFCADATVHMSHAFMTVTGKNRNERVTVAIETVGMPILNGSVSTLLVVAILTLADSFIFVTFCKSMIIIVILVFIHSMIFLPVFLSFIGPKHTSTPRVFIPVSNSARSLQDTYRANSLTRPTEKDIERFNAERLAKLKNLSDDSPRLTRSQSDSGLLEAPSTGTDGDRLTPNSRRVSFAVGDNVTALSGNGSTLKRADSTSDMGALSEHSDEEGGSPKASFTIGTKDIKGKK